MVPRLLAAVAALGLIGLAALFTRMLVVDSGDNAYLVLWLAGAAYAGSSLPFLVAMVAIPRSVHRWALRLGRWGVVAISALVSVLLAASVALIPSQGYETTDVLVAHVVGLGISVAILAVLLFGGRFDKSGRAGSTRG
jgi:hypothetical protein